MADKIEAWRTVSENAMERKGDVPGWTAPPHTPIVLVFHNL